MERKHIETILQALTEKIADLEMELHLKEYDVKKLNEENTGLREELKRLLGIGEED